VVHGVTGLLVEPNRPDEVAESLACLIRNPGMAREMGTAGQRRATRHFEWASVARSIADVYESLSDDDVLAGIEHGFDGAIEALQRSRQELAAGIAHAGRLIAATFEHGNNVLICGNGGSAADAQHFAAELTGGYREKGRKALPAMALTADTAFITAWSNDVGFDDVFARQVQAFGRPGDLLIGISTSGRSRNVLNAFSAARERAMSCLAIGGRDGGGMRSLVEQALIVPAGDTQHIQEVHLVLFHLLCDEVERRLSKPAPAPRRRRQAADGRQIKATRREAVAAA
jgi:phosphoheptose isomerase